MAICKISLCLPPPSRLLVVGGGGFFAFIIAVHPPPRGALCCVVLFCFVFPFQANEITLPRVYRLFILGKKASKQARMSPQMKQVLACKPARGELLPGQLEGARALIGDHRQPSAAIDEARRPTGRLRMQLGAVPVRVAQLDWLQVVNICFSINRNNLKWIPLAAGQTQGVPLGQSLGQLGPEGAVCFLGAEFVAPQANNCPKRMPKRM